MCRTLVGMSLVNQLFVTKDLNIMSRVRGGGVNIVKHTVRRTLVGNPLRRERPQTMFRTKCVTTLSYQHTVLKEIYHK